MAKVNAIQKALEDVSDAAHSLAVHGSRGYSLESSALDAVFLRCLQELKAALVLSDCPEYYDPEERIHQFLFAGETAGGAFA